MSDHTALLVIAFVVQGIFWIASTVVLVLGITSGVKACVYAGLAGGLISSVFLSSLSWYAVS